VRVYGFRFETMDAAKIDCVPVVRDLRHESREAGAQFRMKFHIVFKDQQRLISFQSSFPYSGYMAVRTTVRTCRMAPPRWHQQPRAIGRVPAFYLDLMLLELRLHPGPAVGPSRKIDADPLRKTSLQFKAVVWAIDRLSHCNTGISRQHFPLDPDNAISIARTGRPDRNRHL